ncbi:hypothetical protein [Streptomyces sp. BA2]|uniref:hypothetical protein n=1 Tax=Streptomyces sp. BA2 TaxID=436595 RepID=UPI00132AC0EF|nr:hypothetical protein [Streptomyces sp. BA2]MWA12068.1 hypothetical protein [Streptomyces sp. BA2]
MQNTPIDTNRLGPLWCSMPPEPRKSPDGAQRKDREGNLQWVTSVTVVPKEGRRVENIDVVVSGLQPQGITAGAEVKIINLESNKWAVDGRSGESYRADEITPVNGPAAPGGSAAPASGARGKASGGES